MTLYYSEARAFLITGSADTTLRYVIRKIEYADWLYSAWNTDTGVCLAIFKGHTGVVRGVQFDNSKIISCSMDKTIRIWTFECVRVIEGWVMAWIDMIYLIW